MKTSTVISTREGAAYIRKLCKHFAVKVPAVYTETTGEVQFPYGHCTMHATEDSFSIETTVTSNEDFEKAEGVINRHMEKFAWREQLVINWVRDI